MRITGFNIECINEKYRLGLATFPPMNKLGNVVLLAGKNGSGKSRILRLIKQQANERQNFFASKKNLSRQIVNTDLSIQSLQQIYNQYVQIPEKKR